MKREKVSIKLSVTWYEGSKGVSQNEKCEKMETGLDSADAVDTCDFLSEL